MIDWVLYIFLMTPIILSPGPMMLFCLSNGSQYIWPYVFAGILGGSSAYLIYISLVGLGIGVVLVETPYIMLILRIVGVFYLFWLGMKQWTRPIIELQSQVKDNLLGSYKSLYSQGFCVGIFNPKALVMFLILFPQFINPEHLIAPQLMMMASVFFAIHISCAIGYAQLGKCLRTWGQRYTDVQRVQGKISGAILMSAAFILAMAVFI